MAGEKITFRTTDGSVAPVTAYRDESPPKFVAGFGGWEVLDRPKRTGATRWAGKAPLAMDVAILFDGFIQSDPVEAEITRLMHMAWAPAINDEPPKVRVSGGTPGDTFTWLVNDLSWGDNQIWDFYRGSMVRFRQDVVVHLLQSVDVNLAAVARPHVGGKVSPRYYTVKRGDTLQKIAVKMYGDREKWKVIAKANKIRDPRKIRVGQRLKIP